MIAQAHGWRTDSVSIGSSSNFTVFAARQNRRCSPE
jgi:hypothetical protein